MFDEQIKFCETFPLLVPQNIDMKAFDGFLPIKGEDYHVAFIVPNYPKLEGLSFKCDWKIGAILNMYRQEISQLVVTSGSLCKFFEKLQEFVGNKLHIADSQDIACISTVAYKNIFSELQYIGFENVIEASRSFDYIKLSATDTCGRQHVLNITIGTDFPEQPPVINADLPSPVLDNIRECRGLAAIYNSFILHLSSLEVLWRELAEVDKNCWVIEPAKPTYKDCARRIVIGPNVSLHLQVDFQQVHQRPDIIFQGSDNQIEYFQKCLAANISKWNNGNSLFQNLQSVLEIKEFPLAPDNQRDDQHMLGECCICFLVLVDGAHPSEVCNDTHCGSLFHTTCLYQWLQTISKTRPTSNHITGDCPNCGSPISCQMPG